MIGLNDKRVWAAGLALLVAGVAWRLTRPSPEVARIMPVYAVQKGPLTISVTTGGSVQSRDKEIIKSELEGNNTILWVIDEGKQIKTGDLLLEFDASELVNRHKEQEVSVANTLSSMTITRERLDIVKGDCESSLLDCDVASRLAKMDMVKFEEGDYPQQCRQYEAEISLANEELQRAVDKLSWSRRLADEGFLTRIELQADELAQQRGEIALKMAQSKMSVYTNYTAFQERAKLESAARRTERALTRTAWQNSATLRQVESELAAREREYERATNRLAELVFQIDKSKVYAPTNGIVLYASSVQISRRQWWAQPLRAGGTAVQRQELIYLPVESGMIVESMIPEASLNKLKDNMPAKIKIDAIPGRVFDGRLVKIGVLPDGQSAHLNPDLKLYKCEIEFEGHDPQIRSGMSCEVELVREVHKQALFVPMQCVVRVGGAPRVYVRDGDGVAVAREVRVGLDNNRMIHILAGLAAGEKVLLAPPVPDENGGKSMSGVDAPDAERASAEKKHGD